MEAFTGKLEGTRQVVQIPAAIAKHRGIAKAVSTYERLIGERVTAKGELAALFDSKERAERHRLDREADALLRGKTPAPEKAQDFEAKIEQAQRRIQTVEIALGRAEVELAETFERERPGLLTAAADRIDAAGATYRTAIEALAEARLAYFSERRLSSWIGSFPGSRKSLPAGDAPITAIVDGMNGEALMWSRLVGAMLGELEPPAAPVEPPAVTPPLKVA